MLVLAYRRQAGLGRSVSAGLLSVSFLSLCSGWNSDGQGKQVIAGGAAGAHLFGLDLQIH
jgi:hypothetical protein